MSATKCGQAMTPEILDSFAKKMAENSGKPDSNTFVRIISYEAHKILTRIHAKHPGWNNWHTAGEIYVKARKLGLLDE